MGQTIRVYPDTLETEAQHRIGVITPDTWGDLWAYVEFTPGTYKKGQTVRDQPSSDLVNAGEVTAAAAQGTFNLKDTGEFDGKDYRGAIGFIYEGTGIGQSFQVMKLQNSDILVVQLLDRTKRGWQTALDTTSKYRLRMPGRVEIGGGDFPANRVRGVIELEDFTVPTNEFRYGFVRQTGLGQGKGKASTEVTAGYIKSNADGDFVDGTQAQHIGVTQLGGFTPGSDGTLFPVELRIHNRVRSYRQPKTKEDPTIAVV